ncbi:tetratricopeptide repeat-containing sensor histidine kinase [Flavobacterium silvaticum]|uniref:histidine kinase n=1 Tax=Flavobacterium silvaticum TaxID=1852020 RepID=A0A972FX02_9FLAO|nr:tetratricopeptide repeat-containing sensor histidine kinase [Flavobacterium silvaticum]NMH29195.1 sensor histidine kinase [Flavobacterium silvaticum]
MKKWMLILPMLMLSFSFFGQTETKLTDTTQVFQWIETAQKTSDLHVKDSLARLALARSYKMAYPRGLALAYSVKAKVFMINGDYASAESYFRKSAKLLLDSKDYKEYGKTLSNIGVIGLNNSDLELASKSFFGILEFSQKHKIDQAYALAHEGVATVYSRQENYVKSIEYAKRGIELYRKLGDKLHVASCGHLLGVLYHLQKNETEALKYYRESLKNYSEIADSVGMATDYSHIGLIEKEKDFDTGIKTLEKAQKIFDTNFPNHFNSIQNLGNIAKSYHDIYVSDSLQKATGISKKLALDLSEKYIVRNIRLGREQQDIQNLIENLETYSDVEFERGRFQSSRDKLKEYQRLKDSLFSQDNKNHIADLETAQAVALKDRELRISKLELETRNKQRWLLIALIVFLLIIGGLILWQGRNRKRTNQKLKRLNSELEAANAVKTRFFAILNHDLRSPAASVVNYLQLSEMETDIPADEKAQYRKKIQDSAEFLLETMEDLLLWSKGQMKQFEPSFEQVSVSEVFENMAQLFPLATFENAGDIRLETDIDYLKTILRNLTSNAVKNLDPSKHPEVVWRAGVENGSVILHLTDNGKGAKPDAFRALFDETVISSTRSGLGLHLVRDLARAIHCSISVDTELGKGTHFRLRFS